MPQDSSFCSNSTLGSSASHISEKSNKKAAAIVPDMSGNFFVLKTTIDVPKYHKWLVTEQPKVTEPVAEEKPLPFIKENTSFISKEEFSEIAQRRK